jgi:hypothetical protein
MACFGDVPVFLTNSSFFCKVGYFLQYDELSPHRSPHGTWSLCDGGQRRARCGTRIHRTRQHAHQPPTALVSDAMARRLTEHHLPRHSSTTHYHGAKPRTISRCAHAVTNPCRHPRASFPRCEVLDLRGSRPGRAVTVYNQQQPCTPPAPTHLLAYASTAR